MISDGVMLICEQVKLICLKVRCEYVRVISESKF